MKYWFADLTPEQFRDKIVLVDVDGTLVADEEEEVCAAEQKSLHAIKEVARAVYLVSNGNRERTERMAQREGVFVHVSPRYKKPHPRLGDGLPVGDYVIVGDKWLTDGLFAYALQMPFIAVRRLTSPQDALSATCMHFVDDWFVAPLMKLYGLLRVPQWIKNVLVLAPAFFAGTLSAPEIMLPVSAAVLLFSLTASIVYIINDIRDQEVDAKHSVKRLRPIASGHVSEKAGLSVAVVLAGVVVAGLVWMPALIMPLGAYVVINGLYSFWLKHVPVLDVVLVATSHVLRLLVGGIAAGVMLSPWIVLCTFFGALFLVVAKRRGELSRESRRKVFEYYTATVLDGMAGVAVAGALIAYALYAVVGAPFPGAEYSVIFVATALLRMFMRVLRGEAAAEFPEKLIFKDRVVLLSTALWIAYMGFLIYTHVL